MCYQKITCPDCSSFNLKKNGKNSTQKQKYLCQDCRRQFILDYKYRACKPEVRRLIVPMTMNGSGIRDIARVLRIAPGTVLKVLRQAAAQLADLRAPTHARQVELDEFWSFVKTKKNQRWTWYGLTSSTRRIGALVNGRRTDQSCRKLLKKYEKSQIERFASDDWQSYQKAIATEKHYVGKNQTQRIERRNLNFRTHLKRLQRRTICYSKSEEMHDAVIKLYIHDCNHSQHTI